MDNTYRRDSMKNQRNLFHSSPPRRSKVRFAPTYFLSATENKPSVRFDVFPHPNSLLDCKRLTTACCSCQLLRVRCFKAHRRNAGNIFMRLGQTLKNQIF